jgi:hypothetical protein
MIGFTADFIVESSSSSESGSSELSSSESSSSEESDNSENIYGKNYYSKKSKVHYNQRMLRSRRRSYKGQVISDKI